MKLVKYVLETSITRVVDGFLAWSVFLLFQFMGIKDTQEIKLTDFYANADIELLKWFIIISLVVGIVKVVCLMIGVIKHPDPENCGLGWGIMLSALILWAVIKGIIKTGLMLFAVSWIESHFFLNAGFCNILKIVVIVINIYSVQVNNVPGCLLKHIGKIIEAIWNPIADWINWFLELVMDVLGKRIVLAIIELAICLICTFLFLSAGDKIGLTEKYSEDTTFLLSEWYEENGEDLMLDKLHLDKYFEGSLGEKEISGDTYNFLKVFPVGCAFAGLILLFCGLGLLGSLAVKAFGWNENAMTQYDATHAKRWVRINLGHGKYTESYTNGNLHGLVWFLLLIVFGTLGFMSGIFMPLFIVGNLLIGIISLVLRAVLSSGDNREEAA